MTKFWIGAAAIFLVGVAAVFSATTQTSKSSQLKVNDLETECRYDRTDDVNIDLGPDNSLRLHGHFPVQNTNSNLDIDYSSGNNIVLNIKEQNLAAPADFWWDCYASAVYDVETQSLEPGVYSVEIKHDGERAEKRIIRIRE